MRVLLFLVSAMSVVGSSYPLDRRPARQVGDRVLTTMAKGKFERMGAHYGAKNGETIGGGLGNALGTLSSAAIGTVTGGHVGVRAGRTGLATAGRISGEYLGAKCLGAVCGAVGRQIDKLTKTGRQIHAAEKNQKKAQAEAMKKPVLYSGGDYQKAKLSRTGSSPALLHKGSPGGGTSTSGVKSPVNNKGKAPMNAGGSNGASTSGQDKKPGAFTRAKQSVQTKLRITPSGSKPSGSKYSGPKLKQD